MVRGVTNPVFARSGSGTRTTIKGVGVAWIRIFAGIWSTHGIGSFLVCSSLILIQEAPSVWFYAKWAKLVHWQNQIQRWIRIHDGSGVLLNDVSTDTFWKNVTKMCPKCVQNMAKMCPNIENVQNVTKRCPKFGHMPKIWPKAAQILDICPKCDQKVP